MIKKDIVIFGTGQYFTNYMMCYGVEKKPLFAVDNDKTREGKEILGVKVETPDILRTMNRDNFYVVICCGNYQPIARQLEEMDITDYQYYVPVPAEETVPIQGWLDTAPVAPGDKPYGIGYVPGAFDLFHVGHLNLLRNAKRRCEYLIAGVLTDELIEHFKKKKPLIPYAQRAAIVEAISYVDRVVPVDFSNTYKIDAWKKYHYDCHFSGNDHGKEWGNDLKQLQEVGANMEFFAYTSATSSTQIKELL